MDINKTGIFYMGATRSGGYGSFPKEYRSSLIKRLEKPFLYVLAVCAIVLGGLTLVMSFVPLKEDASEKEILRIQERYAQLVLNQPRKKVKEAVEESQEPAAQEVQEEKQEEKAEESEEESKEESFEQRQKRKAESSEDRRRKREMVSQQVKSSGIFAAITATGSGTGGPGAGVNDLLSESGGVGDLGDIDISKGTFATRNTDAEELAQRRDSRTSGVGIQKSSVGTASATRIASSGQVNITSKPPEMKSESGTTVTSKACIQKAINRESHRIRRVYENWLKRDPSLSGQLTVRFIITASGTVTDVSVVKSSTGNSRFDENILRYIKRWDFSGCSIAESIEIVFPFAFSGSQ